MNWARVWSLQLAAIVFFGAVSVQAKTANRLTTVDYEGTEDRIEFGFQTTQALTPKNVSARTDGAVLIISLTETTVKRHWLKLKDFDIKRALVHPSRQGGAARLRIRFHDKIHALVARNIRVRIEGSRVIAAIPRSVEIARSWAGAAAEPTAPVKVPVVVPKPPKETKAVNHASTLAAAVPVLGRTGVVATKVLEVALPLKKELTTQQDIIPAASNTVSEEGTPVTNAVGQSSSQGPKIGAFAMALLFLLGVGFVMFRKMRQRSAPVGSGPMIRPVGTHMLGPKQGLLLVEVAGDMVLLGTSDKGVQMLTRIEGREAIDPDALAAKVTPSQTAVPEHAMPDSAKSGFAERFGRAVSRIRETTQQPNDARQRYAVAQHHAESNLASPGDALSEIAHRVDDVSFTDRRNLRRDFVPVEPRQHAPVYAAQPPVVQSDDLLNKLRNLQSA